jgi:hypothetical protein
MNTMTRSDDRVMEERPYREQTNSRPKWPNTIYFFIIKHALNSIKREENKIIIGQ